MDKCTKIIKDGVSHTSEYSHSTTKNNSREGVMKANLAEKIGYNYGEKGHISTGCAKNKKNENYNICE